MNRHRLILIALILVLLTAVNCFAGRVDEIVRGAYEEINNGTRYNTDMLERYYAPSWKNGRDTGRGIYPGGDVNPAEGICADLVVRALRNAGIDLQQRVHEDLLVAKKKYGVTTPDKYIDQRRVWILKTWFKRHWQSLPVSVDDPAIWHPGDIVIWDIGSKHHLHIGIIGNNKRDDGLPLVIHNMAYIPLYFAGQTIEQDILEGPQVIGFAVGSWQVIGHYRLK